MQKTNIVSATSARLPKEVADGFCITIQRSDGKRKRKVFFCILASLLIFSQEGMAGWQTNGPIDGDQITAFAISGSNIFAGAVTGGVYLSSNNGTNWQMVNNGLFPHDWIQSLAVSSNNIFAGTLDGGVFLSTNNGTNWTAVNTGLTSNNVRSLAVNGNNLFAGTTGGVYLSTNNGTSWSAVNSGLTNLSVNTMAISGSNLFAGTNGGVYLFTSNGSSWSAVNSGLTNLYVNTIAISGSNIFAGTNGGVYLSTNNGTSWSSYYGGLGSTTKVYSLAISGSNIFAGTYANGIYRSSINGNSWSQIDSGLTKALSLMTVPALAISGSNIFAGVNNYGICLSTNNGTSWSMINTGVGNGGIGVPALAISGSNIFAGTNDAISAGGGVYLSTDNASSWSFLSKSPSIDTVYALAISGSNILAATTGFLGGLSISKDNGFSWGAFGLPSTSSLAISGNNIIAGTLGGGIYLSANNGSTFSQINNSNFNFQAVAMSGNNIFAGTDLFGVILFTNNGSSIWPATATGLKSTNVKSLAVSGNNLFAGTTENGIYLSTNNGSSWSAVNAGLPLYMVGSTYYQGVFALAINGNNIFAGTGGGVYFSNNSGSSWSSLAGPNHAVISLAINDSNLFAGTASSGIFSIPLNQVVPSIAPVAPILLSPSNASTGAALITTVRWNKTAGATTYRVQVSTTSTFTAGTIFKDSSLITDTSLVLTGLVASSQYYWHVNATNAVGASTWASAWSFTTIVALPSTIILVSPTDASTSPVDSITFIWRKGDASVTKYWVEVATDSIFTNVFSRDSILVDTTKRVKSFVNNQSYWWRVKAYNTAGWGAFSAKRKFTINKPTIAVLPSIADIKSFSCNNAAGMINYALPKPCFVSIKYYDLRGRKMCSFVNNYQQAGYYSLKLSASSLSQNIYIQKFVAGGIIKRERLPVIR
ncbi:MAG: hypothetical protein PHC61_14530 [Chitinivibrionales bacterium]|nr:hypothetical protein [Chitinivibrionales bacterium]